MKSCKNPIIIIFILLILLSIGYTQSKIIEETNVAELKNLSNIFRQKYIIKKTEAEEWARRNKIPIRQVLNDGSVIEIMEISDSMPLFYTTLNINAARTISTNEIWPGGTTGLELTGSGVTIAEWDESGILLTHREFEDRVTQIDSPTGTSSHATHVAGTLIAGGVDPDGRGMAYEANLHAYDWNGDQGEMSDEASDGLLLSNHSYGSLRGWVDEFWIDLNGDGVRDPGEERPAWMGDLNIDVNEDYRFGFYTTTSSEWDEIALNAPFYLIVKAAGNDRNDNHPGTDYWIFDGGAWILSNAARNPDGDYDCLGEKAVCKNILTVGAVNDIIAGYSLPSDVNMTSFSSWGPTDDGRIKPDLVANGQGVYSCDHDNDSDYTTKNGTSMASPSVTGSLTLLQEHYQNLHNGRSMHASTAKALVIHTTDEAGTNDGPDYQFGWGLMNTKKAAELISQDASTLNNIRSIVLENTETYSLNVQSNGIDTIKVTIVWNDPPGNPVNPQVDPATSMLVNDLDLRVTRVENSQVHFPWRLDRDNPGDAAERGDNAIDNVEQVMIENPEIGEYTITVNHKGVLEGNSQRFAMIISGVTTTTLTSIFPTTGSPVVSKMTPHWWGLWHTVEPIEITITLKDENGSFIPNLISNNFSIFVNETAVDAINSITEGNEFYTLNIDPNVENEGLYDLEVHYIEDANTIIASTIVHAGILYTDKPLIEKGLAWLNSQQNITNSGNAYINARGGSIAQDNTMVSDFSNAVSEYGSWSYSGSPNAGITALALQAFLAYGHGIETEPYGATVERAINYLLNTQIPSGYHEGAIYNVRAGYETAMAIVALKSALKSGINDPLKSNVENALSKSLNYYTQDVQESWTRVSFRYDRGYTSETSGDLSVSQWVFLGLNAMEYMDKDIWAKIFNYIDYYKGSSDTKAWIGYQYGGTRIRGNTLAAIWGLDLAHNYGVTGASALADKMYFYISDGYNMNQLLGPPDLNSNYVYSGGGYYYYIYELAKALALGGKTQFCDDNWYESLSDRLDKQHREDEHDNYYWTTGWTDPTGYPIPSSGLGDHGSTAMAILSLEVGTVPVESRFIIKLTGDVAMNSRDGIYLNIYDSDGNFAGLNESNQWITDIPNSIWLSTSGAQELEMDLASAETFVIEIHNETSSTKNYQLDMEAYEGDNLQPSDADNYQGSVTANQIYGTTANVNAIGGLTIYSNPPEIYPSMQLSSEEIVFNPFVNSTTYNFEFTISEIGGAADLNNLDIFGSNLVDQFGNTISSSYFSFSPSSIQTISAGGSQTVQGTFTTPSASVLNLENSGAFTGTITVQSDKQTKSIQIKTEDLTGPSRITVTYPNGGETWTMGDVHNIYWTSDNYVGQVMIEISTTGGSSWWDITEGHYTENDGQHYWRPDNASDQCLIRVTSIENPAAQDESDDFFSIVDTGPVKQYTAVHIPDGVAVPTIDGDLNDPAWSHAKPSELLNRGGTVDDYLSTWSDFWDNQVTWRAVWSAATNLLYVAIEIQDNVAGASDNDYDTIWRDDCLEIFTDGDKSGGLYEGQYATAQQWFVRRDNTIHLDDLAGPYTGSAITRAIRYGSNGNWVLEMAMAIYNNYPSNRKMLSVNDKIGWEIWYDDSDNLTQYNGRWDRDHQVGWGYSGPAWENADDFHELIFGPKENQYTPGVYYAKKIPSSMSVPTIDGHFNESFWAMLDEDSCVFGGVPEAWNVDWTQFNDNLVRWKAVWSDVTNKLYVGMTVRDDVRGDFDNSSSYSFAPWQDDCFELYTDGDNSGGYYEGGYGSAQQWFLNGQGKIGIDDYPSSGIHEYNGSALRTAVSWGPNGDWFCEAEFEIYNNFPSSRKTLSLGDIIGWNIWYDDSDNQTTESGSYVRDHQTGWVYNGQANNDADYFGDIVLDDEIQVYPTYFADDFEDGDAVGWHPLNSSRWAVVQDEGDYSYRLRESNYSGDEYSLIENYFFSDFDLNVKMKSAENLGQYPTANFIIIFGYQDFNNQYYLKLCGTNSENKLYRGVNGSATTIATYNGATIKDNNYHNVRLIREGANIKVNFDGMQIMNVNDTTFPTGKIALGAYKYSAYFDDVLITEVGGTPDNITITEPNGGETWNVNVSQSIHWTSVGVSGNVKIEISTNSGSLWTTIAPSVPNTGTYTWTPTSTYISNNCLIKVTSLSNTAIFDQSDAVFSIVDVDRVNLSIATNHSGGQGNTVTIPVNCCDVSGRFVYSGGITISYDPNVLEAVNTDVSGTMIETAGWGATTNNITSGQIAIGMAGSTPLSGSGVLVKIMFQVKGSNGMTTPLQFASAVFNEGDPPVQTSDGFFQVTTSNFDIQGSISYYHNASIAVQDASVQLTGAATRTSTTDAGGNYEFLNLNSGNYTVTPQKTDDAKGSITPYDASMILRASVNSLTLTPYQKIAGDVSGSGDISAYDASFILRYYVGLVTNFPVNADWTFVPGDFPISDANWAASPRSRSYSPLIGDQLNQGYVGVLYGDVSGNWPGSPLAGSNAQVELGIERIQKQEGGYLLIPLEVSLTDEAFSTSFKMLTNNSSLDFVSCSLVGKTEEQAVCIGNSETQGAFIALASATSLDQNKMTINLLFKEKSAVDISSLQFDFIDIMADDNSTTLTVVKDMSKHEIPKEWKLTQNRPNPFNAETTISYQVPKPSRVTIEVYNLLGQRLRQLVDETKEPGVHQIIWNGKDENGANVGSGIYLCKMRADKFSAIKKMVLVQ